MELFASTEIWNVIIYYLDNESQKIIRMLCVSANLAHFNIKINNSITDSIIPDYVDLKNIAPKYITLPKNAENALMILKLLGNKSNFIIDPFFNYINNFKKKTLHGIVLDFSKKRINKNEKFDPKLQSLFVNNISYLRLTIANLNFDITTGYLILLSICCNEKIEKLYDTKGLFNMQIITFNSILSSFMCDTIRELHICNSNDINLSSTNFNKLEILTLTDCTYVKIFDFNQNISINKIFLNGEIKYILIQTSANYDGSVNINTDIIINLTIIATIHSDIIFGHIDLLGEKSYESYMHENTYLICNSLYSDLLRNDIRNNFVLLDTTILTKNIILYDNVLDYQFQKVDIISEKFYNYHVQENIYILFGCHTDYIFDRIIVSKLIINLEQLTSNKIEFTDCSISTVVIKCNYDNIMPKLFFKNCNIGKFIYSNLVLHKFDNCTIRKLIFDNSTHIIEQ